MAPEGTTSHWSDPLASATDRDRFAELVQYHFAHGRLTDEELQSRLDRVLVARTLGELYRICSDLPFPASGSDRVERRSRRRRS